MIQIEKIWKGVREEGVNFGLPMTFVKPGLGAEYEHNSDLTKFLLETSRKGWICFLGEETTQVGMGQIIADLGVLQFYLEVECNGQVRDPGWFKKVERWVVDYSSEPLFDYGKLRSADMARFTVTNERDLALVQIGFDSLKMFPGTKYIKVVGPISGELNKRIVDFASRYDRTRIYYMKGH